MAWDLQLLSAGFAIAVAGFCFLVWLGRRFYPNILVVLAIVPGLAWTWYLPPVLAGTPTTNGFEAFLLSCAAWQLAAIHFYWAFLHGRRQRWMERGQRSFNSRLRAPEFWQQGGRLDRAMLVACVVAPLAAIASAAVDAPAAYPVVAVALLAIACGLAETTNTVRSGNWHAQAFAVAFWLSALLFLADALRAVPPWLSPYSPFLLAAAIGISMGRNLVTSRTEAEELNASLERQLRAREAELAESYAKLREAERWQTLGEERRRLTQDMHDGLGSSLVSALRVVEGGRLSKAELEDVLRGCIDDLKLTIDSMEPVEADLLLLLATLRFRLGPRLAGAGITLHWEVIEVPKLDWLDPRNSLHILRILQEAFANTLKHTQASEIRVATGVSEGGVQVSITDNGAGFDLEAARAKGGKGLSNQSRRAEAIGARVSWESTGGGTRFRLWLPQSRTQAAN